MKRRKKKRKEVWKEGREQIAPGNEEDINKVTEIKKERERKNEGRKERGGRIKE